VTVVCLGRPDQPEREECEGFSVWRAASYTTAGIHNPLAKRAQAFERRHRMEAAAASLKPDVVHAKDTDTLGSGVKVKQATGAKLIYSADELFPEMIVANRRFVTPVQLAYWRAVERRNVPIADATITVGEALAAELHARFGVEPVVLRSVPILEPVGDTTRLRRTVGLDERTVILFYQGLINVGRGLRKMIDIMPQVPDVHFVLQGSGQVLDEVLARSAASPASDRIHHIGHAPVHELTEWAAGADIGDLVIENVSLNNYLAAPNKLYQYMMAGIPTLASDFPEMASTLAEGPAGVVVDPDDSRAVVSALRDLAADPAKRQRMGASARRLAETRYNWDVEKLKLLELYDRLAARSTS